MTEMTRRLMQWTHAQFTTFPNTADDEAWEVVATRASAELAFTVPLRAMKLAAAQVAAFELFRAECYAIADKIEALA